MSSDSFKKQMVSLFTGHDDPIIYDLKRRVYLCAFCIGIIVLSLTWIFETIQRRNSSLDYVAHPLMALYFTVFAFLLVRDKKHVRLFEIFTYVLIFAYFLLKVTLLMNDGAAVQRLSALSVWIPLVYVLGFLIFKTNHALLGSLIFLGLMLIPGVFYALRLEYNPETLKEIVVLAQLYLVGGIYIVLLLMISLLREHYMRSRALAENMTQLASMDFLTQSYNRRHLQTTLDRAIDRARRYGRNVSLIMFDLDHFKDVNDHYGHAAGDQALRDVAEIVRQCIRLSDEFGRWGGEEFLIITFETDLEQAQRLAERLRSAFVRHRFDSAGVITASFGVAMYQKDESVDQLVKRSDQALYLAKSNGRNRVEVAGINPLPNPIGELSFRPQI
ncbi:MAG: GGDEF domain-containing protein [Chloroflexi bacterium]|nr:GGDEF domain-containing protein [Chloroflexota bacterium]MBI5350724.1 GGDEF domain-containing protein [Chloroflexota bacterium]MBI5712508.1 GGDEF domain-containing protein [Chloroflexota bacterium]